MNLQNIIQEIEKVDPEVYDRVDTRRSALKSFRNLGSKLALASIPIAFGSLFKKAYGQTSNTQQIIAILNYALTLEYLEDEFYRTGLAAPNLIPAGAARNAIQTISTHETQHVAFLRAAIQGAGGTPATKPNFDFSARGTFPTVFTSYATFLAVSQAFEDTGVRAYKGRAAELVRTGDILSAALRIHSVEARHAAHIRKMRRDNGFSTDVKPWITGNQTGGIGSSVQAVYNGEENTTQAGVQITNINGLSISAAAASESFDEGLTPAQVMAIVGPFIV